MTEMIRLPDPPAIEIQVEKAQVALPPPTVGTNFTTLGKTKKQLNVTDLQRRERSRRHYEMYRQHPVVRAAIDKKSTFAVAAGWTWQSALPAEPVDLDKVQKLENFLRRSSAKQLFNLTFKDLDIYGEAFWYVQRSAAAAKTPLKAIRLNPRYMEEQMGDNGFLDGWKYGPVTSDGSAIPYKVEEVIQFKLQDPENEVRGLSPLFSLEYAVAQDLFAMDYNVKFFENSAQTGIIFIVKTSNSGEAERNRAWIEQNYVGTTNAHKPLYIEGDVTVSHSVSTPAEMEFLEGRKLLRQEILMVLEMDPDKVGIHENSNRSTARETGEAFSAETIWPRQGIIEEEFNNALIAGIFRWNDVLFQFKEGDPRRKQDLADTRDKDLNSGRETLNEQRQAMGKSKLPGGDDAFIMTPQGPVLVKDLAGFSQNVVDRMMSTGGASNPTDTSKPKLTAKQALDSSQKSNG